MTDRVSPYPSVPIVYVECEFPGVCGLDFAWAGATQLLDCPNIFQWEVGRLLNTRNPFSPVSQFSPIFSNSPKLLEVPPRIPEIWRNGDKLGDGFLAYAKPRKIFFAEQTYPGAPPPRLLPVIQVRVEIIFRVFFAETKSTVHLTFSHFSFYTSLFPFFYFYL